MQLLCPLGVNGCIKTVATRMCQRLPVTRGVLTTHIKRNRGREKEIPESRRRKHHGVTIYLQLLCAGAVIWGILRGAGAAHSSSA